MDYDAYYEYLLKAFASPQVNIDLKIKHTFNYFSLLDKKPVFNEQAIALSKLITEVHPKEAKGFALYGDMSQRVMNTISAIIPHLEIYSIDEAFLDFSDLADKNRAIDRSV